MIFVECYVERLLELNLVGQFMTLSVTLFVECLVLKHDGFVLIAAFSLIFLQLISKE